jgi:ketosteroid isomerase-like protein
MGAQILCLILFGLAGISSAGKIDDVRARVYAWCESWQNRDIDGYMSFYSQNFRSKGLDYRGWMQNKKKHFKMIRDLRVEISDLGVFIEGEYATARFIQRYQDPKISDVGEKTLTMIQSGGKWKIVSEEWKPLKEHTRITREVAPPSTPRTLESPPSPVGDAKQNQKGKALSQSRIIVKSIKFEPQKNRERLFIATNNYFVPKIFTLEGDHPKIVVDIKPVSSWSGPYRTPANGNLIRQIRTSLHADSETLRIVLDLNPSENYYINQIYYEKKNIYCIEIR